MRELQVIGLDAGGKRVLLQEKGSDERFAVPADDRLRAAARGDLSLLGQMDVQSDSRLRPREIQARIRSGASVAEVAELAGIPASRVERYAHPVLLERGNAADLGRRSHPVRGDGPAVQTLDEIVTAVFRSRGLDPEEAEWDAWRTVDGEWIVRLAWQAGRTDIAAHWRLYREGRGGTLTALDEAAAELIDPDVSRPLRPLSSVTPIAEARRVGIHGPAAPEAAPGAADRDEAGAASPAAEEPAPPASRGGDPAAKGASAKGAAADGAAADGAAATGDAPAPQERPAEERPSEEDALIPHPDGHRARSKGRKHKPTMPSWEDVLLGVRSNANG